MLNCILYSALLKIAVRRLNPIGWLFLFVYKMTPFVISLLRFKSMKILKPNIHRSLGLVWPNFLFYFLTTKQWQQQSSLLFAIKSQSNHIFSAYSGQWFIVVFKCYVYKFICNFIANLFLLLLWSPCEFSIFLFIACFSIYVHKHTHSHQFM